MTAVGGADRGGRVSSGQGRGPGRADAVHDGRLSRPGDLAGGGRGLRRLRRRPGRARDPFLGPARRWADDPRRRYRGARGRRQRRRGARGLRGGRRAGAGRADGLLEHGARPRGAAEFAAAGRAAGAAGAIVPDLPLGEAEDDPRGLHRRRAWRWSRSSPRPPPPERLGRICAVARGFVYVVSTVGTTGEREELPAAARRPGRRDQGRGRGAGRGRLRHRHSRAGGSGRRGRRRRDHRQPPGPRRRRGRLAARGRRGRSPSSCARRASPSPDKLPAAWEWSSPSFWRSPR